MDYKDIAATAFDALGVVPNNHLYPGLGTIGIYENCQTFHWEQNTWTDRIFPDRYVNGYDRP